jgi:haloacetate dehalogenase
MPDLADLFPGYASEWINTSAGRIFARVGGKGPPLLLLHGFSETHVMWHRVAPQLADKFTLIVADLPGYGWSDMPGSDSEHTPYTKRAMAQTMIEAMEQLGHVHFALAGHDRGGRVAYRLALDHPGRLSRLAVLDILPTFNYWERMNRLYALKIYHWTFLAQPFPLPETLISGNPDFFLKQKMASQTKSKDLDAIDPRALEHYLAPFRDPSRVHAMCEDYRAGAYADFEIDKKITTPARRSRSRCWRCGACRRGQRGGDAARHLEDLGDRCAGRAGRQRAFFDGGESGRDGEGAAGVFSGGLRAVHRRALKKSFNNAAASLSPTAE